MVQLFVSKVAELKYWIDDAKITPQKWIPVLLEIEALRRHIFNDSDPAINLELSACNSAGAIALRHPKTGVKRHFVNFHSDTTDEIRDFTREIERVVDAWTFKAELKMEPPQPPKEKKPTCSDQMFRIAGESPELRGSTSGEWEKLTGLKTSTICTCKAWKVFAPHRELKKAQARYALQKKRELL